MYLVESFAKLESLILSMKTRCLEQQAADVIQIYPSIIRVTSSVN